MLKKILLWLAIPLVAFGQFGRSGSGNGVTTIADTTGNPDPGKIYYYTGDSTLYTWGAGDYWVALGSGAGLSASDMLDAIADSSQWTAGSTTNRIKPRGGKSVQADSSLFGYLRVTGDTQLDGTLTMNTTASESLKVLAGGIRNEGGLLQKGAATFGATGTQTTITAAGKIMVGAGTPYSNISVVSSSSGQGTGIGITSSQWNKNRTSWATARDTSSIAQYIDSAGGPRLSMKAVDGDSIGITTDGSYTKIASPNMTIIYCGAQSYYFNSSSGQFYPNGNDSYSNGLISNRWQNYYGTDNIFLYQKAQSPKFMLGGQNTYTEETDSCIVATLSSGAASLTGYGAYGVYSGTNRQGRQFYFGPDTLALFNGARTGRDSTTFVLPNGKLVAAQLQVGNSNFTITTMDTVFTAGYVPRWVKFTSGGKSWFSPVYSDTTGKW